INPGKAASHMSPAAARVLVSSMHAAGDSGGVRRASSAAIAEAVFTNSMVDAASRSTVIELMPQFYPTGSGFTLHGRTLVHDSLVVQMICRESCKSAISDIFLDAGCRHRVNVFGWGGGGAPGRGQ